MDWSKYEDEDRRVWRETVAKYVTGRRGSAPVQDKKGSTGHSGSEGEQPQGHDRPYADDAFGGRMTAYDKDGKLLKPKKQPKPKEPKKPLARSTRDTLWKLGGAALGTMIGGGVGGAIGSMIASPRFRKNAADNVPAQAHTQPIPQAQNHDHPLDEPIHKDAGKTLTQRAFDKLEDLQAGKGRQSYYDDWKWDKDSDRWAIPQDESIKSIVTEAIKALRPKI